MAGMFITDDVAGATDVGESETGAGVGSKGRDVDGKEGEGARISRRSASIATSSMTGEDGVECGEESERGEAASSAC